MKRWKSILVSLLAATVFAGGAWAQPGEGQPPQGRGPGMRGMMSRDDGAPKVGDEAPAFKLKSLDGKQETDLAAYRGKRPVVLFFGSYT